MIYSKMKFPWLQTQRVAAITHLLFCPGALRVQGGLLGEVERPVGMGQTNLWVCLEQCNGRKLGLRGTSSP